MLALPLMTDVTTSVLLGARQGRLNGCVLYVVVRAVVRRVVTSLMTVCCLLFPLTLQALGVRSFLGGMGLGLFVSIGARPSVLMTR